MKSVCISTHAPASNIKEAAICVTANTRKRRLLPPATRAPRPVSPPCGPFAEGSRGINARNTAATSASPIPNHTRLKSSVKSFARTEKREAYFPSTLTIGTARITAAIAPLPHSTRLSASSERRKTAVLAPSADRTANSGSRRTVRASTRFATFELAITNSSPDAANRIHKIVLARALIWLCMRVTPIWK